MSILVDFKNITQRLLDFDSEILQHRYQQAPLLRGIAYTLIACEWEGSPDILSDVYMRMQRIESLICKPRAPWISM
ncbi:toxin secretion ATP-binding protein [Vibrio ishigakensis]|uniref:Toxin secretion ATP-binding protein n=1 Tax=Vibrio ishigakensis TaxID=1481914 RepID=A0A0B8PHK0_9VIBR|nr:toxin secretion ATP-binding protein [Vibrio ishigakensis]